MLNFVNKLFGSLSSKSLNKYQNIIEKINLLENEISNLSDDDLRDKTKIFREKAQNNVSLDTILPEVFAVVREASKRTLNMRHFDVQLIGWIVLHQVKRLEIPSAM